MSKVTYAIHAGDNWESLAERFGITPKELAALNHRDLKQPLEIGDTITVPEERPLRIDIKHDLPAIAELNQKLLFDSHYRQQFLENPESVFKTQGIPISRELIPEDFPVLRLLDDKEFKSIAKSGDHIKTREYLANHYPKLLQLHSEAVSDEEVDPASNLVTLIDLAQVVLIDPVVIGDITSTITIIGED